MPTDSGMRMSSIGEHTAASSSEAELGRIRDGERPSPLPEVVVASADPGTRPMPARASGASAIAASEALLEYVNGGRTDHDRKSAQPGKLRQSN